MAPGNCRQPPSKLLCMSHLKVLLLFPQWDCIGSSIHCQKVILEMFVREKWFWRWPVPVHKAPGVNFPAGEELLAVFRIPIPKHAFQITSERSCAEVLHLLQHQQAASSPKFRSVTLCCCISPFLFSPWTSLPLHTLVGKKNQPRNTTYTEGIITHQAGNCPDKRYFNQKQLFDSYSQQVWVQIVSLMLGVLCCWTGNEDQWFKL